MSEPFSGVDSQFNKDLFFLLKVRHFVDKTITETGSFPTSIAASVDDNTFELNYATVPQPVMEEGFQAVQDYLQKLSAHEDWKSALLILPSKASCYAFDQKEDASPEVIEQIKEDHLLGQKPTHEAIMDMDVVVIIIEKPTQYWWTIVAIHNGKPQTFAHPTVTQKLADGSVDLTDYQKIAIGADVFMNLIPSDRV